MIAITQIAPTNSVSRSRLRSTTLEPERLDCIPPPNSVDRPPPRPRCSRISNVSSTLVTINTICRASCIQILVLVAGPPCYPACPVLSGEGTARRERAELGELVDVDAGPADERAVDVRACHQLGDVVGLHRAAVEDPHGRRLLLAVQRRERGAERGA